jgi:hypothetical protein
MAHSGISIVLFAVSASLAWGQNEAALSGTITDSSKAIIAQATVKLTSHAQGTVRVTVTNASGVYQFSFVQPGVYDVEVSAPGFKTLTNKDITLAVAENARRDFALELGGVSEQVTVTADAETVNKESAELGAVIDNTRVVEMPLNGRTFYSLAPLTPNVMPPVQNSNLGFRGGFNVAGNAETNNNFTLNGFDNNDAAINVPNVRPSIDAIQEFNILTGVYPAQYGYASGGQIVVTTKSGGNQVHGSAYEFVRNQDIMAARNFFTPPGPIPPFKRNQFGATIGGPIQKDKTFFFFTYEGLRQVSGFYDITTVPTPAMLTGDFSSIANKFIIKNPTTGVPYTGNVIPPSQISPIGRALAAFYPAPNFGPGTPAGTLPTNNFDFTPVRPESDDQDDLRIDHIFSPKDSVYLSANWSDEHSTETEGSNCGNPPLPGFTCFHQEKYELYGIAETHIFSPSMVNEARVGYTLTYAPNIYNIGSYPFWPQFGIKSTISSVSTIAPFGTPSTSVTGYASVPGESSFVRHDPHFQTGDIFSWTHGKHTIKTGGIVSHYSTNERNNFTSGGGLAFNNSSQGPTSGYGLADLLLGFPASSNNAPYSYPVYLRELNVGVFVQDDYKVSSTLTLNLGLRWEINTPFTDYSGHYSNFNTVTGLVQIQPNHAPIPAGITAGISPTPLPGGDHAVSADYKDYAPRVGFAWQPFHDSKTVIRGGAGTFYNDLSTLNATIGYSMVSTYPYIPAYSYTSSVAQPVTLSNPFPTSNAVIATGLNAASPQYVNARVYEWSWGIQRQLAKDMLLDVTYFGSSGSHFQIARNINEPLPGPGTPAQVQARRPYPAWGTISQSQFDGSSHYESLQVKFEKRYGYGLSFLVGYTYGHSIDDVQTADNVYNDLTARGPSTFDVRHRLVMSPVYELPFGPGKPWLSQGVLGQIVGGWQLSGLFQWQTGTPLTATLSGNFSNTGGTSDRPNLTCNPNANAPHSPQEWFNTTCFQIPIASGQSGALYQFGNEGPGVIVSPGFVNLDVALVRTFRIKESIRLQIRAEMFNTLNHPNFGFPALTANASSFGTITAAQDPRESQLAMKLIF